MANPIPAKRAQKQEHMPIVGMGSSRGAVECDYCAQPAVWFHWAEKRTVDRDAYACNAHVGLLNRNYRSRDE